MSCWPSEASCFSGVIVGAGNKLDEFRSGGWGVLGGEAALV